MAFHINPETGEAGKCRAKNGNCPFGSADEHYPTAEAARDAYETSQATFEDPKKLRISSAAEAALSVDLIPKKAPRWLKQSAAIQKELFGTEPQYLGTITTPAGELAIVWEKDSTAKNDEFVQLKRGYEISRLTLNDPKTGEELGYLKLGSQTQESISRTFGDDEWREFAWADDSESLRGFRVYTKDANGKSVRTYPVREASGEELVAAKRELWAGSHASMRITPPNFDLNQLSWSGLVNLNKDHAPEDEAQLDSDLAQLRNQLRDKLNLQQQWHSDPTIDFIRMSDRLRGKGTGQALYVLGARMLGKQGRVLRASGIQTEFAEAAWKRLGSDPRIPMTTISKKESYLREDGETKDYLCLDFRAKENS